MKTKNNLKLFLILIVLAFIFFIPMIKNFINSKSLKKGEEINFFPDLKSSDISKIEIKDLSSNVVLIKKGKKWIVEDYDYEANKDYINEILDSIPVLSTKNLVSTNPKKFNIFQVDDKSGIKVGIYGSQDKKYEFIIGKIGPDYQTSYCRKLGENNVYLIEKNIRLVFDKGNSEGWLNKTILKFEEDKLKEIKLKYEDEEIFLARDATGKWKYPEDDKIKLNEDAIKNIVNSLSSLTFANLEKGISDEEAGLSEPKKICSLLFSDARRVNIYLGNQKDDNLFYCKIDDKKEIFSIYKWTAENIFKKLSEIMVKQMNW